MTAATLEAGAHVTAARVALEAFRTTLIRALAVVLPDETAYDVLLAVSPDAVLLAHRLRLAEEALRGAGAAHDALRAAEEKRP